MPSWELYFSLHDRAWLTSGLGGRWEAGSKQSRPRKPPEAASGLALPIAQELLRLGRKLRHGNPSCSQQFFYAEDHLRSHSGYEQGLCPGERIVLSKKAESQGKIVAWKEPEALSLGHHDFCQTPLSVGQRL